MQSAKRTVDNRERENTDKGDGERRTDDEEREDGQSTNGKRRTDNRRGRTDSGEWIAPAGHIFPLKTPNML